MHRSFKIRQFKVFEFGFLKLEWELVTVSNFLMNDEADIDAERFARIWHGNFFGVHQLAGEGFRSKLLDSIT